MLSFIGVALNNSAFGPSTTPTQWNNVAGGCTGTETKLYDCPNGHTVSCTSTYVAGVRCYSPSKMNAWCANTIVHV